LGVVRRGSERFAAGFVEGRERVHERRPLLRRQARDDPGDLRPAASGDVLDGAAPLLREPEHGLATVGGMCLPVGEPGRDQPVDHAHRGGRRDLEDIGEGHQLGGTVSGQHHEHAELRQRHPLLDLGERPGGDGDQQSRRGEHRTGHHIDIVHALDRALRLRHTTFLPRREPHPLNSKEQIFHSHDPSMVQFGPRHHVVTAYLSSVRVPGPVDRRRRGHRLRRP
ncbi:hypothetical protein STRIP9103_00971, partial [Streptomyces ipomoeae 91-03]